MSEVCKVEMRSWQRKDGMWSGEAKLKGPSKRNTKIFHSGCQTQAEAEAKVNGDVNELTTAMGWTREDVGGKG